MTKAHRSHYMHVQHVELTLKLGPGKASADTESGVVDQQCQGVQLGNPRRHLLNVPGDREIGNQRLSGDAVPVLQFSSEGCEAVCTTGHQEQIVARAANCRANSAPMPLDAPVIRAVRVYKSVIG